MKALELLKGHLKACNEMGIHGNDYKEAIIELEELMKSKTCDGCCRLYFDEIEKVYKCCNDVSDDVGYLHGEAVIRNIKDFCCNEYKPKA